MTTQEENLYLCAWNAWAKMLDKLQDGQEEFITLFIENYTGDVKPDRSSPIVLMFAAFCFGLDVGQMIAENKIDTEKLNV